MRNDKGVMALNEEDEAKFMKLQQEAIRVGRELAASTPQSIGQDMYDELEKLFVDIFKRETVMSRTGDFLLLMELAFQAGKGHFLEMLEVATIRPEILLIIHDMCDQQTLLGYTFQELSEARGRHQLYTENEECVTELINVLVQQDLLLESLARSVYEKDLKYAIYIPTLFERVLREVPDDLFDDIITMGINESSETVLAYAFKHMTHAQGPNDTVETSIRILLDAITYIRDGDIRYKIMRKNEFIGATAKLQTYLHLAAGYMSNEAVMEALVTALDDELFVELASHADDDGNTPMLLSALDMDAGSMRIMLNRAHQITDNDLLDKFEEALNHVSTEDYSVMWMLLEYMRDPDPRTIESAADVLQVFADTRWLTENILDEPAPGTVNDATTAEDYTIRGQMSKNRTANAILQSMTGRLTKGAQ